MKTFSLINPLLLAGGIISLGFLGMLALAQEAGKVKALQRVKVIRERSIFIIFVVLLLAAQVFFVSTVAAEEGTVNSEKEGSSQVHNKSKGSSLDN